jgi:hypothetical protein
MIVLNSVIKLVTIALLFSVRNVTKIAVFYCGKVCKSFVVRNNVVLLANNECHTAQSALQE